MEHVFNVLEILGKWHVENVPHGIPSQVRCVSFAEQTSSTFRLWLLTFCFWESLQISQNESSDRKIPLARPATSVRGSARSSQPAQSSVRQAAPDEAGFEGMRFALAADPVPEETLIFLGDRSELDRTSKELGMPAPLPSQASSSELKAAAGVVSQISRRRPAARPDRFLPFSAPDLDDSELAELTETLRAGWLSAGPKTRQFEQEFAKFVGAKHAIAVNNGTTAFRLALQAVHLRSGDEVIMSPFAPVAAAELVRAIGAVPRFVDVTENGLHLSPELFAAAINERTRAVMISHVAGLPAEMDDLLAIARQHGLLVIEDAGQALPATYRHHKVGAFGDVSVFTFFAQKALSLGEGGFICTNNTPLADRCRLLVMSPWELTPPSLEDEPEVSAMETMTTDPAQMTLVEGVSLLSSNGRLRRGRGASKSAAFDDAQMLALSSDGYQASMCDLSSAVGLAQLRKATVMWQRRREIAVTYNVSFSRSVELQCPADRSDSQHAWHLYLLRLNLQRLRCSRNQFLAELRARGIGATVMPPPLHLQATYEALGYQPESCPIATQEYAREISLPIYSRMTDDDVQSVIDAVEGIMKRFRAIPNLPR